MEEVGEVEQEILNTQAQKKYDIQKEDKRCERQNGNIQQEDNKFEVDVEEQVIVNIEVDEVEQEIVNIQEQKDNIQKEDNSCELDEEEQEIIPPYFQPLF